MLAEMSVQRKYTLKIRILKGKLLTIAGRKMDWWGGKVSLGLDFSGAVNKLQDSVKRLRALRRILIVLLV
ncbi:hypothetical protein BVRB_2g024560 isoform B [Beta vulgaris subsp. vulgaris]|nr:hypothetical protein BVRB_2g024560 isoform B [Beta vulgaris subsp. vulgaris]